MDRRIVGVCGKTAQEYINLARGKKQMSKKERDISFEYVETLLREKYSTKVKVTKNRVTLIYNGVDDLNRILEIMNCIEK